jgi:hypothetical protein
LAAVPLSPQWSAEKNLVLSLDRADARIGRPLTPGSIAGVNRRVQRRAYRGAYYGAAAAGAAAAYGVGSYTVLAATAIRLMALATAIRLMALATAIRLMALATDIRVTVRAATDIRLMALAPTTGRAFAPPAEW